MIASKNTTSFRHKPYFAVPFYPRSLNGERMSQMQIISSFFDSFLRCFNTQMKSSVWIHTVTAFPPEVKKEDFGIGSGGNERCKRQRKSPVVNNALVSPPTAAAMPRTSDKVVRLDYKCRFYAIALGSCPPGSCSCRLLSPVLPQNGKSTVCPLLQNRSVSSLGSLNLKRILVLNLERIKGARDRRKVLLSTK